MLFLKSALLCTQKKCINASVSVRSYHLILLNAAIVDVNLFMLNPLSTIVKLFQASNPRFTSVMYYLYLFYVSLSRPSWSVCFITAYLFLGHDQVSLGTLLNPLKHAQRVRFDFILKALLNGTRFPNILCYSYIVGKENETGHHFFNYQRENILLIEFT